MKRASINETWRIFKLLMHKNFLVRKRHWILSLLVQVVIPIACFSIFTCLMLSSELLANQPSAQLKNDTATINNATQLRNDTRTQNDTYYPIVNLQSLNNNDTADEESLLYSPKSNYTYLIISLVKECLGLRDSRVIGYETEEDLEKAYLRKRSENPGPPIYGVIFDLEDGTTYKYKIRTEDDLPTSLYRPKTKDDNSSEQCTNPDAFYENSPFVKIQMCLDRGLIRNTIGKLPFNYSLSIQKMPTPAQLQPDARSNYIAQTFPHLITFFVIFFLCVEALYPLQEKTEGIKSLLSLNGVPKHLNLFSWLFSGLILAIFYIILAVASAKIVISQLGNYWQFEGSVIFWLVLVTHAIHLIAFGMHISAYFSTPGIMLTVLNILYFGAIKVSSYLWHNNMHNAISYLGIVFPNVLIHRTLYEFHSYEEKQTGVEFGNMLKSGTDHFRMTGSVAFIIIFSLIGSVAHFLLAVYLHDIYPGKHSIGKDLLYFMQLFKRRKVTHDVELVDYNYEGDKFEAVEKGALAPSIQIRNLRKTYVKKTLLEDKEIEALGGVSIDIYKDTTTVLLGYNGAGKSTLISLITGVTSLTDGLMQLIGKTGKEDADEVRKSYGYCTQSNLLFSSLTVNQQLTFFGTLKNKDKAKDVIDKEINQLLSQFHLTDKKDYWPGDLSESERRRVCLAVSLIGDVKTIVLDEPTLGMDATTRQDTWDTLLKLKDKKTILIGTRDIEEAEALGDRIAIVDSGKIKCYGTTSYLKKLYGQGSLEATLSIEESADPLKIKGEFPEDAIIVSSKQGKLSLNISSSKESAESLDKVAEKKNELGVTDISVSPVTLEQIFLKATDSEEIKDEAAVPSILERITGKSLTEHKNIALWEKKWEYVKKNMFIFWFIHLFMILPIFLLAIYDGASSSIYPLNLGLYGDTDVKFSGTDTFLMTLYGNTIDELGSTAERVVNNISADGLVHRLLEYGKENAAYYKYDTVIAAEFNRTDDFSNFIHVNGFYSDNALFSVPVTINALTNTILKTVVGQEHSIEISYEQLPKILTGKEPDVDKTFKHNAASRVLFFCVFYFFTLAFFAIQPIQETVSKLKQLQRIGGVSSTSFWGTMFLSDLAIYSSSLVVILAVFFNFDILTAAHIYNLKEICILFLLFVLFAMNILPMTYILSFFTTSIYSAFTILTVVPFVLLAGQHAVQYTFTNCTIGTAIGKAFMIFPHNSFVESQRAFYSTALRNARCRSLPNNILEVNCYGLEKDECCALGCRDGDCDENFLYFTTDDQGCQLMTAIFFLCLTPILYFAILKLLEDKTLQSKRKCKLNCCELPKFCKWNCCTMENPCKRLESINCGPRFSWVTRLFSRKPKPVAEKRIDASEASANNLLLAYQLSKRYAKLLSAKENSFLVKRGESMGLLNIDDAAKAEFYKMLMGGEVAGATKSYISFYTFTEVWKEFLCYVGFCPGYDVLLESLTAQDHLRLFGKLRGLQTSALEAEVTKWIERLNLVNVASQPSGSYNEGQKRRLNLAIALIGDPSLILIDEPTAQVDPATRKLLWKVLKDCLAAEQGIIFTSSSIEECGVLCNKLIVNKSDNLYAIKPSDEQKQEYQGGYDVLINLNSEPNEEAIQSVKSAINADLECFLVRESSSLLHYHVTNSKTTWSKMYESLDKLKSANNCIRDFLLISASSQQLFIRCTNAPSLEDVKYCTVEKIEAAAV